MPQSYNIWLYVYSVCNVTVEGYIR